MYVIVVKKHSCEVDTEVKRSFSSGYRISQKIKKVYHMFSYLMAMSLFCFSCCLENDFLLHVDVDIDGGLERVYMLSSHAVG